MGRLVWLGEGRSRDIGGARLFSPRAHQIPSPKFGEKMGGGVGKFKITHLPLLLPPLFTNLFYLVGVEK